VKITRSNINVSPHGGIVPILKKIKEFGIPQLIRSTLGVRKKQAKYGYEDVFIAWILTSLCGGTRLEHISKLKRKLNIIPDLNLPSHDTLGRVMKKLATEIKVKRNVGNRGEAYTHYNDNIPLNRMLIKATKKVGALNEHKSYTLDIDATFVPTECRGAIRKKNKEGKVDLSKIGFNPMVCFIENLPVYISMRDGYANAHFELKSCLQNCIELLEESNINVGKVISDAAGYKKEVFEYLHSKDIQFLVRFPYQPKMETFNASLHSHKNWEIKEIRTANFSWDCEVASIPYRMYDFPYEATSPTWRVVAKRIPLNNIKSQGDKMAQLASKNVLKEPNRVYSEGKWVAIGDYQYKFFITNDYKTKSEDLITEYNRRGNAERQISFMKNDFAWRLPPFMNMNENMVFMVAASLANNIFRGMVMFFKKNVPSLKLNARLKEFQFVFINVACCFINEEYVFYNTDIAFEKIV